MIRVLIVDDHEMVGAGLATLQGRFDELELVGPSDGVVATRARPRLGSLVPGYVPHGGRT